MSVKTEKEQENIKSKKPYTSPELKHFGAIRELTTGGSFGAPEGGPPPSPPAPSIPRRP